MWNLHLLVHARPETIHAPKALTPFRAVLTSLEEFPNITLAVGPVVGTCWYSLRATVCKNWESPTKVGLLLVSRCNHARCFLNLRRRNEIRADSVAT